MAGNGKDVAPVAAFPRRYPILWETAFPDHIGASC
jgi:hypothetical protein